MTVVPDAVRGTFRRSVLVACSLAVAMQGCTGNILPIGGRDQDGPEGAGGTGGAIGEPGAGVMGNGPGTKVMHRLNRVEYNATVRDVLGTTLEPATELWRGGENLGFDNIATVLGIDELQYERYFDAASEVARDVFGANATRDRIVTC